MPIRDLENHEHAEISLKIVVIGGSIAGEHEVTGFTRNSSSIFTTRACCSICTETCRARCAGGRAEQWTIYCKYLEGYGLEKD